MALPNLGTVGWQVKPAVVVGLRPGVDTFEGMLRGNHAAKQQERDTLIYCAAPMAARPEGWSLLLVDTYLPRLLGLL